MPISMFQHDFSSVFQKIKQFCRKLINVFIYPILNLIFLFFSKKNLDFKNSNVTVSENIKLEKIKQ